MSVPTPVTKSSIAAQNAGMRGGAREAEEFADAMTGGVSDPPQPGDKKTPFNSRGGLKCESQAIRTNSRILQEAAKGAEQANLLCDLCVLL